MIPNHSYKLFKQSTTRNPTFLSTQQQLITQSRSTIKESQSQISSLTTLYETPKKLERTQSLGNGLLAPITFNHSSSSFSNQSSQTSCSSKKRYTTKARESQHTVISITQEAEFLTIERKQSYIILDIRSINLQDISTMLKNIKQIIQPDFKDNELQQKIWTRLVQIPQEKLDIAFNISVLANSQFEEFEFKFNVCNLPYDWNIQQLLPILNKVYIQQKGVQHIKVPQLSILMGKIKTQRLDLSMTLFEVINLIINGLKFLVLEEAKVY